MLAENDIRNTLQRNSGPSCRGRRGGEEAEQLTTADWHTKSPEVIKHTGMFLRTSYQKDC